MNGKSIISKILKLIIISYKITLFIYSLSLYLLSILFIFIKLKRLFKITLEKAARICLMALGVNVIINKKDRIYNNRKEIHIANHESPLDALITQGYFCMPSLTTAHLHISKILPGIELVITKYGHIPFDYKNHKSRIKALKKIINSFKYNDKIFYYPSGSLMTPIHKRFSNSVGFLSKIENANIVAWHFKYLNRDYKEIKLNYDPLKLIISRIKGKEIIVECNQSKIFKFKESTNLNIISEEIRSFYFDLYEN